MTMCRHSRNPEFYFGAQIQINLNQWFYSSANYYYYILVDSKLQKKPVLQSLLFLANWVKVKDLLVFHTQSFQGIFNLISLGYQNRLLEPRLLWVSIWKIQRNSWQTFFQSYMNFQLVFAYPLVRTKQRCRNFWPYEHFGVNLCYKQWLFDIYFGELINENI